jgi:superfamily I DNA and/or RNA helicase
MTEGKAVKDFALYLTKFYEDIGIVSPYSQQVAYLQSLMGKNKKCEVKTIDSFQGR